MTTQTPTWREPSSDRPGDRATPGTVVGERYELRTPVGNGGMGTVWRASDTLLRRDVAVKEVLLPPTMPKGERDALCERTLREARAAAALSHPSVVQVYDVVTDGGRPWIIMELLDARSLADMVIDDGPLAPRAVAKIGIAMLGALEVAHAAGVLHRDVKPANVLICNDGRCVLTDFGVARLPTESKLTTPGMVLGSPHFISPERAVGGAFGPPSDLFSLGVTLYTAVEGGPPFDRGDPFETMRAVVEEAPRPPRLAGPLQPVLWGLLDKDPSRRWSVDHARAHLRELLSGPLSRSGQPPGRMDTDPHAVVRLPPGPPPAIRTGRQVGGRAMLDPDEPLTGALTRLRADAQPPAGPPRARPGSGATTIVPGPGMEPPPSPFSRPGPSPVPGKDDWHPTRGRRRAPSATSVAAHKAAERMRTLGREARRPQNRSRLVVIAGLVVVVALAAIAALSLSGSDGGGTSAPPGASTGAGSSAPADQPLIAVQRYTDDRGIVVNVPENWTKSTGGSYVDFTEPAGSRRVRINVEDAGSTARRFLLAAENGLKNNPSRCRAPYKRIGLREVKLAGRDAAELEYTCGTDEKRHGIWRAVVVDRKAYHFYLTTTDAQFGESKVIYDEMVRSFRLDV